MSSFENNFPPLFSGLSFFQFNDLKHLCVTKKSKHKKNFKKGKSFPQYLRLLFTDSLEKGLTFKKTPILFVKTARRTIFCALLETSSNKNRFNYVGNRVSLADKISFRFLGVVNISRISLLKY